MPQPNPELADALIARLNELCQNPDVMSDVGRLLEKSTKASPGTRDAQLFDGETGLMSFLSLLNGVCGIDDKGQGLIAAVLDGEAKYFNGFVRYTPPAAPIEPAPPAPAEPPAP